MKIKALDIYGYGKWVNQYFELTPQLQLIFGQNEAGKSTIQSFIRSILFGFPSKHRRVNQINRYEPRHSDVYGGRILLIDTAYGDVWVERTNKGLFITNSQGENLESYLLDHILGGLDENLFDSFYAFSLQNLQELSNIDADKLSDYFLSIGTVGSDKFLKVAKNFEKDLEELYKPKGKKPLLNRLLNEYEELQGQVQDMQANMVTYDDLFAQQQEELAEIDRINQTINQLDQEQRQLDQLMGRFDIYQKDQAAQKELDQLVYTKMDQDLPDKLEAALKSRSESQKQIQQMEERIKNLSSEMSALTRLNWGQNHENERRVWASETARIKEVHLRLEAVNERIQEQTTAMARLAREGQFYPEKVRQIVNFDQELAQGYEIQAQLDNLYGQKEAVQAERKVFLDQRRELQSYSMMARQQYAKLENIRMNEKAQLLHATRFQHYFVGLIFLLAGLGLGLHHWLKNTGLSYRWIAMILAGIGLLAIIYVFIGHRKSKKQYNQSPALEKMAELKTKDLQYQDRSQSLGQDINQREASLRSLDADIIDVQQDQQRWLVSLGFYPTADAELILKSNPIKEYLQVERICRQYEEERNTLNVEIAKWRNSLAILFERFPVSDQSIKVLIHHVEETEVSIARQIERGNAMEERMANANELIDQAQEDIREQTQAIEEIFQVTNSFDEIDFRQKVHVNQEIDQLKAKRELYAEQLTGYEDQLTQIESKQALITAYNQAQHELTLNKQRVQSHQYRRANLEVSLNQLEQDGSYQTLQQKLADKESQILEMGQEWGRKKIAIDLIHQTLRQGMDNPIPEMNRMANELFAKLTYGRYTKIKLNDNSIKVMHFSDVLFAPHELSQGTLEQLYVALRLSFIANASSMVSMPVFIDDAFVNFDEMRKASMYEVLRKVSQKNQVLFFTFDQQAKETLKADQTIDLDTLLVSNEKEEK